MDWAERVSSEGPVFRGRCEWCAKVMDGFEGVEVAMPSPGKDWDGGDYRRFCDEACAKAYDAAEEERYRHKQHPASQSPTESPQSPREAPGDDATPETGQ